MSTKKLLARSERIIKNLKLIDEMVDDLGLKVSALTQDTRGPKGKTPKTAKAEGNGKRAYTRRPPGDGKPRIQDAIVSVMASTEMDAPSIFAALKAKDWVPASNDPKGYISFVLSSSGLFDRTRRGFYRAKGAETSKS